MLSIINISKGALNRLHYLVASYKIHRALEYPTLCILIRDRAPIVGFVPPSIDQGEEDLFLIDGIKTFIEEPIRFELEMRHQYIDLESKVLLFEKLESYKIGIMNISVLFLSK